MTIKDRVGKQRVHEAMMNGKGKCLTYVFFEGQMDPAMFFADIVMEPEAYGAYHRHERHDTILFVLSGTVEHYQDGERCNLGIGDAVLIKSGHAHAVQNTGGGDSKVIEFGVVPTQERLESSLTTRLRLPEAISDW